MKFGVIFALGFCVFLLNSCIVHFLQGTEGRVQLVNESTQNLKNLRIVKQDSSTVEFLIEKQVLPESRSRVFSTQYTGRFYLMLDIAEQSCLDSLANEASLVCWKPFWIGKRTIPAGSVTFRMNEEEGTWIFR